LQPHLSRPCGYVCGACVCVCVCVWGGCVCGVVRCVVCVCVCVWWGWLCVWWCCGVVGVVVLLVCVCVSVCVCVCLCVSAQTQLITKAWNCVIFPSYTNCTAQVLHPPLFLELPYP